MKNNLPYYMTWSSQDKASFLELSEVEDFHYILKNKQKVLDFSSVSYQASFGFKPKIVIDKVTNQLNSMALTTPKSDFILKQSVANTLLDLIDLGDGKIFYTVSGAESVENALKMARQVTKRNVIVSRKKSYHGATLGAVSITGDWRNNTPVTVDDWTLHIPEPCDDPEAKKALKIIQDYGPEKIAAICLETITGNNGVIIPSDKWYAGIQEICDQYEIKLILDEVICGFYRTGKQFGFQNYPSLKPDFICLAKAITGGVIPFGAIWTSPFIANYFNNHVLSCGLTNYAHPLGLAATEGVLEIVNSKINQAKFNKLIKLFHEELQKFSSLKKVKEIRKIGLLAAIDYDGNISWDDFISKGIFVVAQKNRIILAPPLTMPEDLLVEGLELIFSTLENL